MLLLSCSILVPKELQAQTPLFFDDIGASPRAIALGQAFTAVADGPEAAYYNPAGLTQIPSHLVVGMGFQYVKPMSYIDVRMKNGDPYVSGNFLADRPVNRSEERSTRGMWTGIASNFAHLSVFNDPPSFMRNFAFGVVMFNGLRENNEFWNPQRKQDPYHLRYNNNYCLMSIAISMGCRITDYLSVGMGIMPRVDTLQDSAGSYVLAQEMVDGDNDSGIRVDMRLKTKVFAEWIFGVLFKPPVFGLEKRLSLGVTYRRELDGFYGTGRTDAPLAALSDEGNVVILFPLTAYTVDYIGYNPAQVAAGMALRLFKGTIISADLTWKDYSKFKFFWGLAPDPRFKDTWIPRVGIEHAFHPGFKMKFLRKIDKLKVQGGYYYEPSPVPDMNGAMNILDSDMHVVSAGAGLEYLLKGVDRVKVQTYFKVHFAEERVLHNTRDLLFGVIRTGGEIYSTGISVSIQL